MLPGGDLVLENIHPSQEGVYQCRAENKIGAVTAEARVTVRERPVLTVTPETRLQVRLPVPYLIPGGEQISPKILPQNRQNITAKKGISFLEFPPMVSQPLWAVYVDLINIRLMF